MKIKRKLQNILYRLLVVLVDHKDEEVDEGQINDWLIFSYKHQGFKDFLTNEYTKYTRYLTSAYRPDYQNVVDRMTVLRQLEKRAKEKYENAQDK